MYAKLTEEKRNAKTNGGIGWDGRTLAPMRTLLKVEGDRHLCQNLAGFRQTEKANMPKSSRNQAKFKVQMRQNLAGIRRSERPKGSLRRYLVIQGPSQEKVSFLKFFRMLS